MHCGFHLIFLEFSNFLKILEHFKENSYPHKFWKGALLSGTRFLVWSVSQLQGFLYDTRPTCKVNIFLGFVQMFGPEAGDDSRNS